MFKYANCGKEFNYLYAHATEYNTYLFTAGATTSGRTPILRKSNTPALVAGKR